MADRLDTPKESRRSFVPKIRRDPDAVGRVAEAFARFMGTGTFLLYMSAFVVVWVSINAIALWGLRWDPFPFILLNLFFSVQASYAAPLILLAQNRQADRDRVAIEQDRQQAERNLADTEYLAREMAGLRIALSEVATRDFVRSELRNLLEDLAPAMEGGEGSRRRDDRGRRDSRNRKEDRKRSGAPERKRKEVVPAEVSDAGAAPPEVLKPSGTLEPPGPAGTPAG